MFWSVYLEIIDKLRLWERELLFDYLGIVDFARGWVIDENKIRYGDIADKHQLRDEQSVTHRYRKIVDEMRTDLEKQGWIEGEHTPKLTESTEKDEPELTDLDREIINYAVRK